MSELLGACRRAGRRPDGEVFRRRDADHRGDQVLHPQGHHGQHHGARDLRHVLKNKGVQKLLDAIVDYMPAPTDVPAIKGINPETEEEVERHSSDDEPFAALAFKIATDPFVGKLCFLPRVFRHRQRRHHGVQLL